MKISYFADFVVVLYGFFFQKFKKIEFFICFPPSRFFILQGRALSRAKSRRKLDYNDVLDALRNQGIAIRVASPKLVMEEAPESYKNVTDVVDTCHAAGISKKAIKLRPIAVIKG